MDSLTDVFAKRREQLRLGLAAAGTVPQVLNLTTVAIDDVVSQAAQAGAGASARDEQLLAAFVGPLIQTLRLPLAVKVDVTAGPDPAGAAPSGPPQALAASKGPGVVAAALGTAVGMTIAPYAAVAVAVGVTGGMLAAAAADSLSGRGRAPVAAPAPTSRGALLSMPGDAVVDCLQQAFEGFDAIRNEVQGAADAAAAGQVQSRPELSDFPSVLDFLHTMLEVRRADDELPSGLRRYLGAIDRILSAYGISTLDFEHRTSDDQFIAVNSASDIETTQTRRPALVKDGKTLAQGHIVTRTA
ncbi:MAG: hypothetical protein QM750_09275 [Rubrivivax sp.]